VDLNYEIIFEINRIDDIREKDEYQLTNES